MADWSQTENELIVSVYFEMLQLELRGQSYNKTQYRKDLLPLLDGRSHGSVEFKHQNISAILVDLGYPYISGYKPLSKYQREILPDVVMDWIMAHPEFDGLVRKDVDTVPEIPKIPSVEAILAALVDPPEPDKEPYLQDDALMSPPTGINYLEREMHNRRLGRAGEQFVLNFERARLVHVGRPDLAEKVEHVAETKGDGLGYDVLSFEDADHERPIEVKTTKNGKYTPFYLTRNELRVSGATADYHLYRVFDFRKKPRLFMMAGDRLRRLQLEPTNFIARVQ